MGQTKRIYRIREAMKARALITGIAALFLATGTAQARLVRYVSTLRGDNLFFRGRKCKHVKDFIFPEGR